MSSICAYVSVGSNINPELHIPEALKSLRATADIAEISTHYRTAPVNNDSRQSSYLNGVWRLKTALTPAELKRIFREIEGQAGRVRQADSHAPRTLDLDLLMWADLVDSELGIPDDDVLLRPFLFGPLLELDNELIWPLTRRPLRDMVDISLLSALRIDEEMTLRLKGQVDG